MSEQHDPLCHRGAVWEDMTPTNCVGCIVIGRVRADERALCVAIATEAAGKAPTLGQQRMLRALRGEA